MARPSSRPGGQAPRPRRRGRLSPTNGSVTREDIRAIHAEFARGCVGLDSPPTDEEFLVYLLGAISDYRHPPSVRRKMRNRWKSRRARPEPAAPIALPTRVTAAA